MNKHDQRIIERAREGLQERIDKIAERYQREKEYNRRDRSATKRLFADYKK